MKQYPFISAFIRNADFGKDHFFNNIDDGHPNLPAFEYFFSLEGLPGFDAKIKDITRFSIGLSSSIPRQIQWTSFCAEVISTKLIVDHFGVTISGFDQNSPKSKKRKKKKENNNCDIKALWQKKSLYFEVKNNSKKESQDIPEGLPEALRELDIGFSFGVEAKKRYLVLKDVDQLVDSIKEHLSDCEAWRKTYAPNYNLPPNNFDSTDLLIRFFPSSEYTGVLKYYSPPSISDLCSYLIESGRISKSSGKIMTPMVEFANQKGADYLICRIPGLDSFEDIISSCFRSYSKEHNSLYYVRDDRLGQLNGIILFNSIDKFCLINNEKGDSVLQLQNVV